MPVKRQARKKTALLRQPNVSYYTRELSRCFSRSLEEAFAPYGVSLPQFLYLRVLWEYDGLSQVELSERIGVDRGTATVVLAGMERAALIKRVRDATDGRKMNVLLTAIGSKLRDPMLRAATRVNAVATRGLSEAQIAQVKGLLAAMATNLRSDRSDAVLREQSG